MQVIMSNMYCIVLNTTSMKSKYIGIPRYIIWCKYTLVSNASRIYHWLEISPSIMTRRFIYEKSLTILNEVCFGVLLNMLKTIISSHGIINILLSIFAWFLILFQSFLRGRKAYKLTKHINKNIVLFKFNPTIILCHI